MDQNTLIALLNDIAGTNSGTMPQVAESEVFFNSDGQPTDRFLEALKMDLRQLDAPSLEAKALSELDERTSAQRGRKTTASYRPHHRASSASPSPSRSPARYRSASPSQSPSRSPSPPRSATLLRNSYDKETYSSIRRSRSLSPSTRNTRSPLMRTRSKHSKITATAAQKTKGRKKFSSSIKAPSMPTTAASSVLMDELCAEHQQLACKRCRDRHRASRLSTGLATSATGVGSTHSVNIAAAEANLPQPSPSKDLVYAAETVESEAKVRSLELRLQGQLQCIKSLETQYAQAMEQLTIAQKIISQLQAKNKQLAAESSSQHASHSFATKDVIQAAEDVRLMDIVEKLKQQCKALQGKLSEESARRQRSEERVKAFRDYAEKARTQCTVFEAKNVELKAATLELSQKMAKYRKSYRDLAAEVAALRNEMINKDAEVHRHDKKVLSAQEEVRIAQKQADALRNELFEANHTIAELQQSLRHAQWQCDMHEERAATQKMSKRLGEGVSQEGRGLDPQHQRERRSSPHRTRSADKNLSVESREGSYEEEREAGLSRSTRGASQTLYRASSGSGGPLPPPPPHSSSPSTTATPPTRSNRNVVLRMAGSPVLGVTTQSATSRVETSGGRASSPSTRSTTPADQRRMRSQSPQRLRGQERVRISGEAVRETGLTASQTASRATPADSHPNDSGAHDEARILSTATNQTVQLVRAIADRAIEDQERASRHPPSSQSASGRSGPTAGPMASPESLVDYRPNHSAIRSSRLQAVEEASVVSVGNSSTSSGLAKFERLQQLYDKVTSRSTRM